MSDLHDADPLTPAAGNCGNNCADALDRLWEYLDAELGALDAETVRAHLSECQGCLEEYDVDVVVKTLVRRGCQEAAPDGLRLKIHEQLTVMRVTRRTDAHRRMTKARCSSCCSGPSDYLSPNAQALGRLPWFAALPLRERRLRPRLLMGSSFVDVPGVGARAARRTRLHRPTSLVPSSAGRSASDIQCVSQPTQSVIPFLHALASTGGSDLHCKVGSAPRVRVDGRLRKLQVPDLKPADTERMLEEVLPDDLVDTFREHHEADFAYSVSGVGRFRVNAYQARGTYGMVFRRVAVGAQALAELALPEVIGELALEPRGLVLVTGPDRVGQDDDAGVDGRPHQHAARGQHRHHRGPDRDPAPGQEVDRVPARGPPGHRRLHGRAACRDAPGPRRDPRRRDA